MNSTRTQSKRGFSLIEVAIALAIFVIGALAIIRIFPGALNVINNNGDQLVATNLSRSALAALQSESAVPDATFNLGRTATGALMWPVNTNIALFNSADHSALWSDSNSAVAGIARFNNSLPDNEVTAANETNNETGLTPPRFSALSSYNAVQAEPEKVFQVSANGQAATLCVLTRFPIAKVGNDPTTAQPYLPMISRDISVQNVRVANDGTLDFTKARNDDANGTAFAMTNITTATGSMLYVSYNYKDASSNIWGISQEAVPVLTGATTYKVSPPTTGAGAVTTTGVVAGVVNVTLRQFLGAGSFLPTNNFEKVADARRGLVTLPAVTNPLTPIQAGDKVKVDYVADWSYLLQEGVPTLAPGVPDGDTPSASSTSANTNFRQIALGAPFVENQASVSIYSLFMQPTDTTPATSSTNGLFVWRSIYGADYADPTASNSAGRLITPNENDLRAGRATFSFVSNGTETPSTPSSDSIARVTYKTRDNWAEQLSVAAMAYKPYAPVTDGSNVTVTEPWRDYVLADSSYLYFHAGEAGKSVLVSYKFTDGSGNANVVVARPFVISTDIIDRPGSVVTTFATSGKVARLQLTDSVGNAVTPTSIQAVNGTSVTIRTAYMNGAHYAQAPITTNVSRSLAQ